MQKLILPGKKTLVLGLGVSGRSAVYFLLEHKAIVHGMDRNIQKLKSLPELQSFLKKGLTIYSEEDNLDISHFDLIVISPGISHNHHIVKAARLANVPVIGEIELGCQFSSNPMFGITGTNGKTTVTYLVNHVLNHCGYPARALGNIEVPLTRELLTISPDETIVLELSSYQIETLYHRSLDAAVLLNVTPDHLDRYQNMEAYANSKCEMARCIKPSGHFYIEEKTWQTYGYLIKDKISYLYGYDKQSFIYTDLINVYKQGKKVFEVPIILRNKKSHDLENLLAAYALCAEKGISGFDFIEAWKTFRKPSHRIEFITEFQGVRYYDDSKGTNIDAVIKAVESLQGMIILIAGGVDKGASYHPWLEVFKNRVKSICAIGQAAGKIRDQIAEYIPVTIFNTLNDAVIQASRLAKSGEIVLLSPGCSSYDMFQDYAHRGREFQRIVWEIVSGGRK